VTFNQGSYDVWLVRTDVSGNILSQHSYGGIYGEKPADMIVYPNGDCLIASQSGSDEAVVGFHGYLDTWLLMVDASGDIKWQRDYGGINMENPRKILSITDRLLRCEL
jgi:hypothetical protein